MRWNRFFSIVFTMSLLSCNPVKSNDAFLFTLINGLTTTTTNNVFTIGPSSKINVTSASVVLTYGTSQTFGISLGVVPTSNVTINLAFDTSKLTVDGNGTTPLTAHLTFTPGNYNSPQLITLASLATTPTTSNLNISSSSLDTNFNSVSGSISIRHRVMFYTGSSFLFREDEAISSLTPYGTFPYNSCSVNPALPSGLSLHPTTCVISGTPTDSQPSANYTVTATDGTNNDTETISIQIQTTVYKVFVTASTYNGNLQGAAANGPAGADAKCNADANKPATGTFKAMLTDGTGLRRACNGTPNCTNITENSDWVFREGRNYIRANDSAFLFSPNSAGILPASSNTFSSPYTMAHAFDSGPLKTFWTGLAFPNSNWQTANAQPTNTCTNWTSGAVTATASQGGRVGNSNATNYIAFRNGANGVSCDTLNHLVCVEQ
ncbi:PF07588 family protein [Leptospira yanagawae serovar Saopaulo str. Sao Paulo = ATCC 700523]|uniref:PF07588 family protein n=1 Tax=Leptospira yanagawae serovar Saopaulo str. Sao Paulo = ATCC 700523 TaxID=1249483 RepID=A0A5E8HF31_9LEPT|nr:DUF1554 domain-containing protein [Leptospira yanagawae]EOQ89895.1 PF07588 family protein [Leptospira yanagawae serovar Saopaulo str. Sao Paulo = ATCC 700523]